MEMDSSNLIDLLEDLDDNIDGIEEKVMPLIKFALSESAAKLGLLERAKLYVLVTYAIESILFSFLRLQGVDAKAHPVFRELTRTKLYFEKIKIAEFGEPKRENLSLDKPAIGRFIKHALAGNDRRDLEQQARAEVEALKKVQVVGKRKLASTEDATEDADLEKDESSANEKMAIDAYDDASAVIKKEKKSTQLKRKGKKHRNKHKKAEVR